jgi:hypothetical protein
MNTIIVLFGLAVLIAVIYKLLMPLDLLVVQLV